MLAREIACRASGREAKQCMGPLLGSCVSLEHGLRMFELEQKLHAAGGPETHLGAMTAQLDDNTGDQEVGSREGQLRNTAGRVLAAAGAELQQDTEYHIRKPYQCYV